MTYPLAARLQSATMVLAAVLLVSAAAAQPGIFPQQGSLRRTAPMIVLDAHEDTMQRVLARGDRLDEVLPDGQVSFQDWERGGINAVWFAAWINPRKYQGQAAVDRTIALINALRRQEEMFSDRMEVCDTASDVRRVVASGKLAALIGIEGGIAINDDLSMLARYRQMGVRRMNITWKGNLKWAGSSQPLKELERVHQPNKGLNEFGRAVVREMNRLGIVVDLSHCSDKTFYDCIGESRYPVILSHSNARALAEHPRNISDAMLVALRENGGVIGVNFFRDYLIPADRSSPDVETVLDQIDHIIRVAGIDHVGIGSDWDGDIKPAAGLERASGLGRLFDGMRRRGYSDADIRKFAGENFLRVLEANEPRSPRRAP